MTPQATLPGMSGRALRDKGIAKVSAPTRAQEWLWGARRVATWYCRRHGAVTAELVRAFFPLWPGLNHNLWGGLFKDPRFILLRYTQARHKEAHYRRIGVWGLKGDGR